MTEPRTKAGKQLLANWDDMEGAIGVGALILAIEAEAAQPAPLDGLREIERLERMLNERAHTITVLKREAREDRAALRAEGETP